MAADFQRSSENACARKFTRMSLCKQDFSQLTDSCAHECLWLGWLEGCVHVSRPGPVAFACGLSCTHLFTETGQEAEGMSLQTGKAFQNLILELS